MTTNNNNEKEIKINDKIKVVVDCDGNVKVVAESLNDLIDINIETSEGKFKIQDGAYINYQGLIIM